MSLILRLSDEKIAALKAEAEAHGMTLEHWLEQLIEQHTVKSQSHSIAHLQKTNPKEWARQFRAWADGHDPNIPVLSDEAMNRESIYPD